MGQTCCGTTADDRELNYQKTKGARGEAQTFDPEQLEMHAVVMMQKMVRGWLTRRAVQHAYGF